VEDQVGLRLQRLEALPEPDLDRDEDLRAVDRDDRVGRSVDDEDLGAVVVQVMELLEGDLDALRIGASEIRAQPRSVERAPLPEGLDEVLLLVIVPDLE